MSGRESSLVTEPVTAASAPAKVMPLAKIKKSPEVFTFSSRSVEIFMRKQAVRDTSAARAATLAVPITQAPSNPETLPSRSLWQRFKAAVSCTRLPEAMPPVPVPTPRASTAMYMGYGLAASVPIETFNPAYQQTHAVSPNGISQ